MNSITEKQNILDNKDNKGYVVISRRLMAYFYICERDSFKLFQVMSRIDNEFDVGDSLNCDVNYKVRDWRIFMITILNKCGDLCVINEY